MANKRLTCGLLGGREKDLTVLSEIHRQKDVEIVFVYDRDANAVGLEIAEILGIPRYTRPEELAALQAPEYVVVSEPRTQFAVELDVFAPSGANILTPNGAIERFCGHEELELAIGPEAVTPYTIEDTLVAIEKLLDRRELLKFLLEVAVKATSSNSGSIMLYSAEAKELYIAYAMGLSERVIKNTRQKMGEGVAGTVALSKEAQLIRQPKEQTVYAKDRERLNILSAMSTPLMWEGRLLGVLNVSSSEGGHEHDHHDLSRLKALSKRLSRVLSESLKLQQLQVRHREALFRSTMSEIATRGAPTPRKFITMSRYLADLVSAETVDIYLNTTEGDWFVLGGSNRLLTPTGKRVRFQRGALNRAYMERRAIVLTEGADEMTDPLESLSSVVYAYLPATAAGGVIVLEFAERHKLDEFLLIKNAILGEVSRFITWEMRERELKRELDAYARTSDVAATLLGCGSVEELTDVTARVIADILECEHVSVRLRDPINENQLHAARVNRPGTAHSEWQAADEQTYKELSNRKKSYSMAFLTFDPVIRTETADHQTLLACPILDGDDMVGGVLAYDKLPDDPLEEAVFTETDRLVVENMLRLIRPAVAALQKRETFGEPDTYEQVLEGNVSRFEKVCESEISRSDRYHRSFAVVVFRIAPLDALFDSDATKAFALVDEIMQGLKTRTRKTDFGTWVDRSTFAMLSLEGGRRIRFLLSRAMTYLHKDLSGLQDETFDPDAVLVGSTTYPGTARSARGLLREALESLEIYRPN